MYGPQSQLVNNWATHYNIPFRLPANLQKCKTFFFSKKKKVAKNEPYLYPISNNYNHGDEYLVVKTILSHFIWCSNHNFGFWTIFLLEFASQLHVVGQDIAGDRIRDVSATPPYVVNFKTSTWRSNPIHPVYSIKLPQNSLEVFIVGVCWQNICF